MTGGTDCDPTWSLFAVGAGAAKTFNGSGNACTPTPATNLDWYALGNALAADSFPEVTSQAGAIGLALFATAMGLMTAIPLVFTHVMFKDWGHRFEIKMRSSAQKLLVMYQNFKLSSEKKKKRESA